MYYSDSKTVKIDLALSKEKLFLKFQQFKEWFINADSIMTQLCILVLIDWESTTASCMSDIGNENKQ